MLLIISAQERLGVVSKQKGNISVLVSAKMIWKISAYRISAKIQYRASLVSIIVYAHVFLPDNTFILLSWAHTFFMHIF